MENSRLLTLSFPPSYLGDKRTAFGQALTFNLSFPGLSDALTSSTSLQLVKGFLKVVPFATRLAPPETLMVDFYAGNTDEPQQAKVVKYLQSATRTCNLTEQALGDEISAD